MLTGKPLFQGECEIEMIFKIFELFGTPTEEYWPGVTYLPYYKPTLFHKFSQIQRNRIEQSDTRIDGKTGRVIEKDVVYGSFE